MTEPPDAQPRQQEILTSRRRQQRVEQLRRWWPFGLVMVVILGVMFYMVQPPPPKRVVIATGSAQGTYYAFGKAYEAQLRREGIDVEVRATAGSMENLRLLREGAVDVAFVQGGTAGGGDNAALQSLASVYFEPLWLFARDGQRVERLSQLKGKRLAIGASGSGVQPLVRELLRANGIMARDFTPVELSGAKAAEALTSGQADAAFFVTSPNSAYIKTLLHAQGVHPVSIERRAAYEARYRYLSRVTIAEGLVSLPEDLPAREIHTVAASANIVARQELHPALAALLLVSMRRVHHKGGLLEAPGAFPNAKYVEIPLGEDARRFFEHGPPLLQRYLPFDLAVLADRLKLMLLPLLTLLLPLLRFAGPVYRWRMRSRIYWWYEILREMDQDVARGAKIPRLEEMLGRLELLEGEVAEVNVPLSYMEEFYHLRLHIVYIEHRVVEALVTALNPDGDASLLATMTQRAEHLQRLTGRLDAVALDASPHEEEC